MRSTNESGVRVSTERRRKVIPMSTDIYSNAEVASQLVSMGFNIFPCTQEKRPATDHWKKAGISSEWKARAVWGVHPEYLPAIWPGPHGLVVIDCDRKNGKDGSAVFQALCSQNGIDLSAAFIVQTPSGGLHFYFRTDTPISNKHQLGDGIDVCGIDRYVIAPGAVLTDGRAYQIVAGDWDSIPALPEALRLLLKPKQEQAPNALPIPAGPRPEPTKREIQYAQAALRDEVERLSAMREGQGRNAALNAAAKRMGEMVGSGWIDGQTVENALWEAAAQNGYRAEDGDQAALATLRSGLTAAIASPRAPLPQDEPIPDYIRQSVGDWIAATTAGNAGPQEPFRVEDIKSPFAYESKPIAFVIPNLVAPGCITMLTGDSGCGKTTLVTKLAAAISEGRSFPDGSPMQPRPVLYLDGENTLPVVQERLRRLRINPNSRFKYWGLHVTGDLAALEDAAIQSWVVKSEPKPVIFIDSKIDYFKGKENDSDDSKDFFRPLRKWTAQGAAVVVLHHTGKGETTKVYRGASDTKAQLDIGYVMTNAGDMRLTNLSLKAFKARITVSEKLDFVYSNGEFIPQDARQASDSILNQILRDNPGINRSEFKVAAKEKRIGRNEADNFLDTGIGMGRVLTRPGEKNAQHLFLKEAVEAAAQNAASIFNFPIFSNAAN